MKNSWLMLFVAPLLTYAGMTVQEEDYDEPIGQYELAMEDDSLDNETFQDDMAVSDEVAQTYYDEMVSEGASDEFVEAAPVITERKRETQRAVKTQQPRQNVSGNRQANVGRSQAGTNSRPVQRERQEGRVQQRPSQKPANSGASHQSRPRVTQRASVDHSERPQARERVAADHSERPQVRERVAADHSERPQVRERVAVDHPERSQVRERAPSVVYDEGQYTKPVKKQSSSKRSNVSNERQEKREGKVTQAPRSSRESNNSRMQNRPRQNQTAYSEKANKGQPSKMQAKKRMQKVPSHYSGKRPRAE